jgi:Leucine-rich repeat (LRR) protein
LQVFQPERAGGCVRLQWLDASSNKIAAIPDSMQMLKCLRGLILDDNRLESVPSSILKECFELHTFSVRANPITMEKLRSVDGFDELAKRRKGKLDKVVDAKLGADFSEAADYSKRC